MFLFSLYQITLLQYSYTVFIYCIYMYLKYFDCNIYLQENAIYVTKKYVLNLAKPA